MSRREQIEQLLRDAIQGSAGGLARDVEDRSPNTEEMIGSLIATIDALIASVLSLADGIDALSPPQAG